jgi:membrane protein
VDLLRPVKAFDAVQQRHKWLAIPMAVVKKFSDDQAGSLAALVAYYAFFSLFPLLLVFVTILGFVLQSDPQLQQSISTSVLRQFPVIGDQLTSNVHPLKGHIVVLIFGVLTSLLSGLGITNAAQKAFDTVWAVPMKDRPDFLQARLRGLLLLALLGAMFIAATVVTGLVTGGLHLGGALGKAAAIFLSLLLNIGLFLAAFRFMTAATIATRCLWVGVIFAAVFWEILQVLGGIYIGHVFKHETATYGVFGLVIALLVFLHLGAQLTLYSAEINVVVTRKLWPRSLLGPPSRPADEETLTALAKVEERHDSEQVEVEFKPS